jgi:hypothetical protein
MNDRCPFPAVFSQGNPWPLLANASPDLFSPVPTDPWNQAATRWWQQPANMNAGTVRQGRGASNHDAPAWLSSRWHLHRREEFPRPSRGILGRLGESDVAEVQTPPWLQSAMPFASSSGSQDWRLPAGASPNRDQAGGFDWTSMARKAVEPFTSYPQTYSEMNREGREQVARGLDQIRQAYQPGVHDPIGFVSGLGNVGLGAWDYARSPVNAALRTIVGKPFEETFGIPKEYTEFAASLGLPYLGLRGLLGTAGPKPPPALQFETAPSRSLPTRPLTALEEIQQMRFEHARNLLREVDPTNPLLSAFDTSRWRPQSWAARGAPEVEAVR